MTITEQKDKRTNTIRLIVIIFASIALLGLSISQFFYFKSTIQSFNDIETDLSEIFIAHLITTLSAVLPVLLLIFAAIFHQKRAARILITIVFAIYFASSLYNLFRTYLPATLNGLALWNEYRESGIDYPLWDYAYYFIKGLFYCIAYAILTLCALNSFKRKWLFIVVFALVFFFQEKNAITQLFYYFGDSSVSSYIGNYRIGSSIYEAIDFVASLLARVALFLYCLICSYPPLFDFVSFTKRTKQSRKKNRVVKQYNYDIEELNFQLQKGAITQEEYDEVSAELYEEIKPYIENDQSEIKENENAPEY